MAIFLVSILLAFIAQKYQHGILDRSLDAHINSSKSKVISDIGDQFKLMNRMVSRWEIISDKVEILWRHDAKNYVSDIEGFDTFLYVNSDRTVNWVEKSTVNEFIEGMNLNTFYDFTERLNQAETSNQLELSEPYKSATGGYSVYLIKSLQKSTGFMVARINTLDFFNKVFMTPKSSGFYTRVNVNEDEIFSNDVLDHVNDINKTYEINIDSDPEGILFTIYPTQETINAYLSLIPEVIVFTGFLVSLLFYWAMYSRLKSKLQATELATEINQKQFVQKKLEHMAHFDALTNLPNRYLMSLHLDKKISKNLAVWLFYLDLDLFKDVNDTLGHGVGDQLLIELSRRLEAVLNGKGFIARIGGDEFVVVFDGMLPVDMIKVRVKKILQVIGKPFYFDEEMVRINGSVGISHYPSHCDTVSELITHADTALRYVKSHGRHNYKFYDVDLAKSSHDRLVLLNKIKEGIKKSEFELVYQPRVNVKTGVFWGAEALIRWSQKDGSLLTPKVFLQILEDSGLIVSVGWQVLDKALDQFNKMLKYNNELCLSYNVSAKQLESPNFVEDLINLLNEKKFPKELFELELTEQTLITDLSYSKGILEQVKAHGISIAIDDFGTGYSSLSYLKNFPVDVIKIDKSFVKDIAIQKNDYELINAIISMGKNLNVKVVAEGIETLDQLNILSRLGCDEAQGYYFNKPASYEVFKEIVAAEAR